jgi:hypothetical protein
VTEVLRGRNVDAQVDAVRASLEDVFVAATGFSGDAIAGSST